MSETCWSHKLDILMSETCWAHKKWNKIASDIMLVFYSSAIKMMHGPINISKSVLELGQWPCHLTASCGSHNVKFVLYETCHSSLLTDCGDDYNRVEQGAGEGPLDNCLFFGPVPAVGLHRPQQILLECLQPVSHFACPCFFFQHYRLLNHGPDIFCDVVTYLTDITFYLQQWNTITSLLHSVLTGSSSTLQQLCNEVWRDLLLSYTCRIGTSYWW